MPIVALEVELQSHGAERPMAGVVMRGTSFVPGMEAVGDPFAKAQMFLPDMAARMASAEAIMSVTEVTVPARTAAWASAECPGLCSALGSDSSPHTSLRMIEGLRRYSFEARRLFPRAVLPLTTGL
jgi:hypothetical protein